MATKFFFYRRSCVDRHRVQNIYRMNRRPYIFLLDLKEKCPRYVGVSTKETDLFDRHDHCTGQNNITTRIYSPWRFLWSRQTNSQDTRDEDSAKSGTSQDGTPLTSLVV